MAKLEQYEFNWETEPAIEDAVPSLPMPANTPLAMVTLPPAPAPTPDEPPPVTTIVLPWNFRDTFPTPLDEAIGAGILCEDDLDEEAIRTIHEEHAAECLALLADMDALESARQEGTDPRTGKKPRTEKSRQRLNQYMVTAPATLAGKFDECMNVYENAFGEKAATAFRSVLHAWHRGIPVVLETRGGQSMQSDVPPALPPRPPIAEDKLSALDGPQLPCPTPLDDAVQCGVFGCDEDGEPVRPSPEEVEEITAFHADRMMDLLDTLSATEVALARGPATDRAAQYQAKDRALSAYQAAIGLYAEDFGDEAARRLDRWVQHQVETDRGEVQYDPGHPWHYLDRGDGHEPMPVDEILPAPSHTAESSSRLPRDPAKRQAKLQVMLKDLTSQLDANRQRYTAIVENGPAALSDFDRNIAHGGDEELAWASAVALKYSHIRNGLARCAWIKEQLDSLVKSPAAAKKIGARDAVTP